MLLREAVGNENRPLSWVVGPESVDRGFRPSMRDLKQEDRVKATTLRPMDEV